ncbi:glycerate kinase [Candidatus Thermokryptus mobilis]|uniref:Glycerate kinase n=1 Tax=Candidatus Thermokryptus mobilis TaxID=1643428 RepID=A0A0S4MRY6_9BACT|nr:glycerate kinase [Candidatus Thermokryptus mobilis]CUU01668.1 glycerate kinase [Candidatus Thermokryptus mobilis]
MKVVIAPDSFKGSLSSVSAAQIIANAFKSVNEKFEVLTVPVSDGGEGFVESLHFSIGGKLIESIVTGPLPYQRVKAKFLTFDSTAVIEMASASGLTLVPEGKRDPKVTTTYGVGELIKKAIELGAKQIIVGVGGSATNDGGMGMASALGYKFIGENGKRIKQGGINLLKLKDIDDSEVDERIRSVNFKVAVDVLNPLCGPSGASFVYGPQKGAKKSDLKKLDMALRKLAKVVKKKYGIDIENLPGAGAAGGLSGGLVAFCGAEIVKGIDLFLDMVKFDEKIKDAKLIITGEGKIDSQVKYGKVLTGIVEKAKRWNVPVVAITGKIEGDMLQLSRSIGLVSIFSMTNLSMTENFAMKNADKILFNTAVQIANLIEGLCLKF